MEQGCRTPAGIWRRRRVAWLLSVLLISALLLAGTPGCFLLDRDSGGPNGNGSGNGDGEDPVFDGFTVVDPASLENEVVAAWVTACTLVPGVHAATFDGANTYILAAREVKPTAGYTVRLDGVTQTQGGLKLTFRTADPSGGAAAQVISFPVTLLLMAGRPEVIDDVVSTGPESLPWPVQSPANAFLIATSPLPGDAVSTLSLRVEGWARCFEATLQYSLEDGHDVLASGFATASAGGPEWGWFEIDLKFEQPTSPGLTLRLFEYSAEDGSVIHEAVVPLVWQG
jgi:hypothetical protein